MLLFKVFVYSKVCNWLLNPCCRTSLLKLQQQSFILCIIFKLPLDIADCTPAIPNPVDAPT